MTDTERLRAALVACRRQFRLLARLSAATTLKQQSEAGKYQRGPKWQAVQEEAEAGVWLCHEILNPTRENQTMQTFEVVATVTHTVMIDAPDYRAAAVAYKELHGRRPDDVDGLLIVGQDEGTGEPIFEHDDYSCDEEVMLLNERREPEA